MKRLHSTLLALVVQIAHSAELPSLNSDTKVLHIPLAGYTSEGSIVYFQADLQASSDFSSFTLVSAELVDSPSVGGTEGDINLSAIDGTYEGSLSAFEPGSNTKIAPFASCPPIPFNPGSTTLTISADASSIDVTVEVFPDLTCVLSGSVAGSNVNGTFECSDFNRGSWNSDLLKNITNTEILVAEITFAGNSCSFDTNFSGLRD